MMIIIYILGNALAIMVADRIVPGFSFHGHFIDLVIASTVLGIVNSFIKPIVKFLTFPIIILTLGFFSIIINISLLMFAAAILPNIAIDGFWSAFWAVIVISLVNNIILSLGKPEKEQK
ncbi:MAG: phage holin family protein [Candidatus Moranbacteria bacterium]|nr:phage holin family protein [Candidatus Moranbacteria bacterium]